MPSPSGPTFALQRKLIHRWLGERVLLARAARELKISQRRLERWLVSPGFQAEARRFIESLAVAGRLQQASADALRGNAPAADAPPPQPAPHEALSAPKVADLLSRLRSGQNAESTDQTATSNDSY